MSTPRKTARAALNRYAEVVALWNARFDTAEIAARVKLDEAIVARFVANFRDQSFAVAAPQAVRAAA